MIGIALVLDETNTFSLIRVSHSKNTSTLKIKSITKKTVLKSVLKYLNTSDFDVVIPMNSPFMATLIQNKVYLKPRIFYRVADNTHFGYKRVFPKLNPDSPRFISTPRQRFFLRLLGVSEDNLIHIPHSVSPSGTLNPRKNINRVSYIGRFEDKQKGVFTLARLAFYLRKSPEITLNLVGDGVHKSLIVSVLRRLMKNNSIKVYPSLNAQNLSKIYSESDLIFFPSFHEGFGYVLVEAMSHGCIVLSRKINGVTDYIIKDNTQLYKSYNLGNKLSQLISGTEEHILDISKKNYLNYNEHFNNESVVKKWDENLREKYDRIDINTELLPLKSNIIIRIFTRLKYLLRLMIILCLRRIMPL